MYNRYTLLVPSSDTFGGNTETTPLNNARHQQLPVREPRST